MADLSRYPIGPYEIGPPPNATTLIRLIEEMAAAPALLRAAVDGLTSEQVATPYRPGGWTVGQVVHHLADAQMNWYSRTKLTLTEERPMVTPWDENTWAELPDARVVDIAPSLKLFEGVCQRWTTLSRSIAPEQWKREMVHPTRGVFVLDTAMAMHVWHVKHHTAQITGLRERMGW